MSSFQTFKDLSVTFKKHPVTDDLVTVKDKSAIVQAISNLLLTNKGERVFQPDLGSGLKNALFEPLDYGSAGIIRSAILETIAKYEPRIRLDSVEVIPNDQENGYNVELSYTIIGRNEAPQAVELFLERTR